MAELTDAEIVAACARAVGAVFERNVEVSGGRRQDFVVLNGARMEEYWYNPLTDRAQAMELGESDPVLFAKVVGVWASRGGKDNLLHMICHAFAGKQIEKEKNANV